MHLPARLSRRTVVMGSLVGFITIVGSVIGLVLVHQNQDTRQQANVGDACCGANNCGSDEYCAGADCKFENGQVVSGWGVCAAGGNRPRTADEILNDIAQNGGNSAAAQAAKKRVKDNPGKYAGASPVPSPSPDSLNAVLPPTQANLTGVSKDPKSCPGAWCAGCGGFCGTDTAGKWRNGKTCYQQQQDYCPDDVSSQPCWVKGTCTACDPIKQTGCGLGYNCVQDGASTKCQLIPQNQVPVGAPLCTTLTKSQCENNNLTHGNCTWAGCEVGPQRCFQVNTNEALMCPLTHLDTSGVIKFCPKTTSLPQTSVNGIVCSTPSNGTIWMATCNPEGTFTLKQCDSTNQTCASGKGCVSTTPGSNDDGNGPSSGTCQLETGGVVVLKNQFTCSINGGIATALYITSNCTSENFGTCPAASCTAANGCGGSGNGNQTSGTLPATCKYGASFCSLGSRKMRLVCNTTTGKYASEDCPEDTLCLSGACVPTSHSTYTSDYCRNGHKPGSYLCNPIAGSTKVNLYHIDSACAFIDSHQTCESNACTESAGCSTVSNSPTTCGGYKPDSFICQDVGNGKVTPRYYHKDCSLTDTNSTCDAAQCNSTSGCASQGNTTSTSTTTSQKNSTPTLMQNLLKKLNADTPTTFLGNVPAVLDAADRGFVATVQNLFGGGKIGPAKTSNQQPALDAVDRGSLATIPTKSLPVDCAMLDDTACEFGTNKDVCERFLCPRVSHIVCVPKGKGPNFCASQRDTIEESGCGTTTPFGQYECNVVDPASNTYAAKKCESTGKYDQSVVCPAGSDNCIQAGGCKKGSSSTQTTTAKLNYCVFSCEKGYVCKNFSCQPDTTVNANGTICIPGTSVCSNDHTKVRTCNANGSGYIERDCQQANTCDQATATCTVEKSCFFNGDCGPDATCQNNHCKHVDVAETDRGTTCITGWSCMSGVCDKTGGVFGVCSDPKGVATCPDGTLAPKNDETNCPLPIVCAPGTFKCDPSKNGFTTCSSDGVGWVHSSCFNASCDENLQGCVSATHPTTVVSGIKYDYVTCQQDDECFSGQCGMWPQSRVGISTNMVTKMCLPSNVYGLEETIPAPCSRGKITCEGHQGAPDRAVRCIGDHLEVIEICDSTCDPSGGCSIATETVHCTDGATTVKFDEYLCKTVGNVMTAFQCGIDGSFGEKISCPSNGCSVRTGCSP